MNPDTLLTDLNCVVIDVETTGLSKEAKIIEVAAVRLENWQPTQEFQTLVNPEMPIPHQSTEVHEITDSMVMAAPLFPEIAPGLAHLLQNAVIVGHNLYSFDKRFLMSHFRSVFGASLDNWAIDTLYLARKLLPDNEHKLEALSKLFGIPLVAHYAMSDVYATAEILLHLVGILQENGWKTLADLEKFKSLKKFEGTGLPHFKVRPHVPLLPRKTESPNS